MEYYNLGNKITAFTTDRTVGRDRGKIAQQLSFSRFMYPHQTHTDCVRKVTEEFFTLPEEEQKAMMEGVDAVISNVTDACIGISTADCIPVLVYDPVHHCAAAIHAGWRGTVARIAQKAIAMMQREYGTVPSECHAAIGPGISLGSFEVGWEVHQQFVEAGLVSERRQTDDLPRPHLDLKDINRRQLLAMGMNDCNVFVSDIDTFTNPLFFSARREQKGDVKCGRLLSGFILK